MSENLLGYCPVCGEPGHMRERRPNGDNTCVNGHKYPSRTALKAPPPNDLLPCPFCENIPEKVYCDEGCCGASLRAVECKCGAGVWADRESVKIWNKRIHPGAQEALQTLQGLLLAVCQSHIERKADVSAYGLQSLVQISQLPEGKPRSLTAEESRGVHEFIMSQMKKSEGQ